MARDAGIRIDHLPVGAPLARRLAAAGVDRHVRLWEKTSDHAPVWIELTASKRGATGANQDYRINRPNFFGAQRCRR